MKKKKLKVFGMSNQDSGVQFYRINQPLRFMAKQKLANVHKIPYFGQHRRDLTTDEFREFFALEGKWADVVFSTAASDRDYLALLWGMKAEYGFKLVIDVDDDVLSTHTEPNNPAYKAYMNKEARYSEFFQACVSQADLLTVSTEYLKKRLSSLNKNIVVVKNCVDPKFFSHKNNEDPVTLGYTGSGSHQADWKMIEPELERLRSENDNVKLKMLGPMQCRTIDDQVNWVEQLQHPKVLADMGFSVGLAPLKDSLMNRSKSNLRWLEYSALSIPTVASDVVPFREVENIVRVSEGDEWYNELDKLIKDKKYRQELGRKANLEMKENYDPGYWSRRLYDAISSL